MTDVFLRYLQVLLCAVVQMFLYATDSEEQSCGCCSVLAGLHQNLECETPRAVVAKPGPATEVVLAVMGVQRAVFWCTWLLPHLNLQSFLEGLTSQSHTSVLEGRQVCKSFPASPQQLPGNWEKRHSWAPRLISAASRAWISPCSFTVGLVSCLTLIS